MVPVVDMVSGKEKGIILRYARQEYGAVKDNIFDAIDNVRSAALEIDGVDRTFAKTLKLMNKRVTDEEWKFQMKYSTKYTGKCSRSHPTIINAFE